MPSLFYEEYSPILVALIFCFFILTLNRFNIYSVGLNLHSFFKSILISVNFLESEPFERKKTMLILSSIFFISFCLIRFMSLFILIEGWVRFLYVAYCLFLFWMFRNDVIPFLLSFKPVQLLIYYCMVLEEMILSSSTVSCVVNSILFFGGLICYVIMVNDFLPVQILSFVYYFYRTATRLFLGSNLNDLQASYQSDLEQEPLEDSYCKNEDFEWALVSLYMSRVSLLAFGKPIKWKLDDRKSKSLFPLVVKRHFGERAKEFFMALGRRLKIVAESASDNLYKEPLQNLWGGLMAGGSVAAISVAFGPKKDDPYAKIAERALALLERLEKKYGVGNIPLEEAQAEFDSLGLTQEEFEALDNKISESLEILNEIELEATLKAIKTVKENGSEEDIKKALKESIQASVEKTLIERAQRKLLLQNSHKYGLSREKMAAILDGKKPTDTSFSTGHLLHSDKVSTLALVEKNRVGLFDYISTFFI